MAAESRELGAMEEDNARVPAASRLCGCSAAAEEGGVHLALPLPPSFSLRRAVCSYGFFMTAPNSWIPHSPGGEGDGGRDVGEAHGEGLLERPLRLANGQPVFARIFQTTSSMPCFLIDHTRSAHPNASMMKLGICLPGVHCLTDEDKDCILAQVTRMLRLSEMESAAVTTFQALHPQAKAEGFGRLFRSPTLFEDMIKSLLLCNCGWGRTLTMAKALCELQAELKGPQLGWSADCSVDRPKPFKDMTLSPQTPEGKDLKRKRNSKKKRNSKTYRSVNFAREEEGIQGVLQSYSGREVSSLEDTVEVMVADRTGISIVDIKEGNATDSQFHHSLQTLPSHTRQSSCIGTYSCIGVAEQFDSGVSSLPCPGAFPIPEELASLDINFLAKRCGLGYRAKRIWKLARDICDGVVNLELFEGTCKTGRLQVEDLKVGLLQLQGFGPFTCANVLMCLGEYGTVPADTETVRHLKQVHGRTNCTVANVSREVAEVYAQYAPFQFLAYWFELWGAYEKKFGQLSCMAPCNYGLITGHNMRTMS